MVCIQSGTTALEGKDSGFPSTQSSRGFGPAQPLEIQSRAQNKSSVSIGQIGGASFSCDKSERDANGKEHLIAPSVRLARADRGLLPGVDYLEFVLGLFASPALNRQRERMRKDVLFLFVLFLLFSLFFFYVFLDKD